MVIPSFPICSILILLYHVIITQENAFACGKCRELRDFSSEDNFVSIDVAVSRVREEVPSLMELLRERVNMMSSTRAELDTLLGRVDQEKVT